MEKEHTMNEKRKLNAVPTGTRIVRAGWQRAWTGPAPRGCEIVGVLVPGTEATGLVLHNTTVWKKAETGEHMVAIGGDLLPMQGPLPPVCDK
jgi:hypothetical protein